ncbi:uncharacterized protein BDZ99DRAFT_226664 [Mytilinidion resinicola]|uniref:Uncharacterized protein n=1 Tax=Mytilinidion resinicola TaxID=574789 RepID=A0A6A6Z0W8_9PEZI|nr:uncharacterized protein BDZ99DRAFT_226664 [Mytilinidion resinicola]KAF2813867.1 hypothetical protein BDZ99DRAFT_226664 [Mytilinidion resinicola]
MQQTTSGWDHHDVMFRCDHEHPDSENDHPWTEKCGASIVKNTHGHRTMREATFFIESHHPLALIPKDLMEVTPDKATVDAYKEKISEALKAIDMPACPHLRVSSRWILDRVPEVRPSIYPEYPENPEHIDCKASNPRIDPPCWMQLNIHKMRRGQPPYIKLETRRYWTPEQLAEVNMER